MRPKNTRPMANLPLDLTPRESRAEVVAELEAHLMKRPTSYSAPTFAEWARAKERLEGKLALHDSTVGKWRKI